MLAARTAVAFESDAATRSATKTAVRKPDGAVHPRRDAALPGGLDPRPDAASCSATTWRRRRSRASRSSTSASASRFSCAALDFTILMLVAANPDVTQRQMSLALDVSAPRLTMVCDKLEERALITRTRSEADRRKQYIALTRKGAALVQEGRSGRRQHGEGAARASQRDRAHDAVPAAGESGDPPARLAETPG